MLVPITERAATQRINRKIKSSCLVLYKSRGTMKSNPSVGDYYIIDTIKNSMVKGNVNLTEYGRSIGAVKPWEKVGGQ